MKYQLVHLVIIALCFIANAAAADVPPALTPEQKQALIDEAIAKFKNSEEYKKLLETQEAYRKSLVEKKDGAPSETDAKLAELRLILAEQEKQIQKAKEPEAKGKKGKEAGSAPEGKEPLQK